MLYHIFLGFAVAQLCAARNVNHQTPQLRIIGGKEAVANIAPYMVYIELGLHDPDSDDMLGCGGSLITPQHVLTAAHCLVKPYTINYIILGALKINKTESTQQKLYSEDFVIHKDYGNPKYANDIAIIKLKTPATLNNNVKLVTLPIAKDTRKTYVGKQATAYGWGLIHQEPHRVKTDVTVDLKVISNADCLKKAPYDDVYEGDLCTDGTGPKDTCRGDSGGPLMVQGVQIGITSRGTTGDCERNDPGIYVRVTKYLKWIDNTVKFLS